MRRFLRVPVICIVLLAMLGPPIVAASPIRVDCASDPAALSEAVAAASPGAMLVISGTCVGNLVLDKDLTIVGGSEDATLTGEPHVGVLRVSSSAVVSLSNVAVKMWGAEPSVIQLRNEGTLTLTDVTISHGPVDAIRNGGSLTLRHSTVTDNRGKGDAPITNVGGTVTIIQSLITRNRNTEVIAAIVNSEGGTVTLIGSTVSDNSGYTEVVRNAGTMTLVNSVFTGNVAGRADLRNRGTLSLTDSVVSDNEVWNAASGCSEGCAGGIENYGTLLVRGSEVQGNRGGQGGGIYNAGTMTVLGSTVSGNTATGDGGGIFNATDAVATMHGTIVEVNSAGLDGGGIFNQGTVTLRGVRLRDNTPNDCTGC